VIETIPQAAVDTTGTLRSVDLQLLIRVKWGRGCVQPVGTAAAMLAGRV
jgi:hypothetical protein